MATQKKATSWTRPTVGLVKNLTNQVRSLQSALSEKTTRVKRAEKDAQDYRQSLGKTEERLKRITKEAKRDWITITVAVALLAITSALTGTAIAEDLCSSGEAVKISIVIWVAIPAMGAVIYLGGQDRHYKFHFWPPIVSIVVLSLVSTFFITKGDRYWEINNAISIETLLLMIYGSALVTSIKWYPEKEYRCGLATALSLMATIIIAFSTETVYRNKVPLWEGEDKQISSLLKMTPQDDGLFELVLPEEYAKDDNYLCKTMSIVEERPEDPNAPSISWNLERIECTEGEKVWYKVTGLQSDKPTLRFSHPGKTVDIPLPVLKEEQ